MNAILKGARTAWRAGAAGLRVACLGALTALAVTVVSLLPAAAQTPSSEAAAEYKIKAAFLYKFSSYIEWPGDVFSSQDEPLVIGIVASPQLAEFLRGIVAGRTVEGRAVEVRDMAFGEPLAGVHMLFVGGAATGQLASVIDDLQQHSVLTVTETEDSIASGSVINFVVVDDRVRFDVELDSAQRSGLRISARLLTVARKVYGEQS